MSQYILYITLYFQHSHKVENLCCVTWYSAISSNIIKSAIQMIQFFLFFLFFWNCNMKFKLWLHNLVIFIELKASQGLRLGGKESFMNEVWNFALVYVLVLVIHVMLVRFWIYFSISKIWKSLFVCFMMDQQWFVCASRVYTESGFEIQSLLLLISRHVMTRNILVYLIALSSNFVIVGNLCSFIS